jgi:hypothetical protein
VLRHQLLDQLLRRLLHMHARMGLHELGELRSERGVGRHGHAPGRVAQEEAPGPVHRVRLGQLPEVGGRAAVPDVEEREVRLAVLAHLERQLRGRRLPAVAQLARAQAREIVEPQALELLHELRALLGEGQEHPALAGLGRALELGGRLALKGPHEEVASSVAGHYGADRPPAIRVAQPRQHLRARDEVREATQQRLDVLGHARVRGHSPVLAAPVEPAARQLLDGLVQLLVKGEIEDDLGLTRIVFEEPNPARGRDRLVGRRVSGQTVELSYARSFLTGGTRTGAV